MLELFGLQLQTRQPGEVGDLLARDARHAAFLWGECVVGANRLWQVGLAQSYGAAPRARETVSPAVGSGAAGVPGGAAQEVVVVPLLDVQEALGGGHGPGMSKAPDGGCPGRPGP
ncbi:hypothetical protein GCM10010385_59550 [Streptomyces geysiriensis]|nr:hypothetical protein GCM10010385_59550 [Streptomyces geysiriensis]